MLDNPKIELRREAIDALERMSGETWGEDAGRWQAWWNSLATVRDEDGVPSFGRMIAAAVVGDAAARRIERTVTFRGACHDSARAKSLLDAHGSWRAG